MNNTMTVTIFEVDRDIIIERARLLMDAVERVGSPDKIQEGLFGFAKDTAELKTSYEVRSATA